MPVITFNKPQTHAPFEVREGDNLMTALLAQKVPVASSCLGKGICGKCRIQIIEGAMNLSSHNTLEAELHKRLSISGDCRISCQTSVLGDICIDTSYW